MIDLKDTNVILTGATGGIGNSILENLILSGANVLATGTNEEKLNLIKKKYKNVQIKKFDISNHLEIENFINKANEILGGRIDVLINNAGILRDGMFIKAKEGKVVDKMSLAQFQSVIDVNLTGVFLAGREAASHMIESGKGGVIVNMSSVARAGNIGQTNYAASKAGVVSMTTGWAKELGRFKHLMKRVEAVKVEAMMTEEKEAAEAAAEAAGAPADGVPVRTRHYAACGPSGPRAKDNPK